MSQLWTLGCSHTAGVGIGTDQCYANLVAKALDLELVNLAVPGGNHSMAQHQLLQQFCSGRPAMILAQWPNIYRLTVWRDHCAELKNAANACDIFQSLVKAGPENFVQPWLQTVISTNMLCRAMDIPILNIVLETLDQYIHQELERFDIKLYQDEKLPGQSWIFDSAASDKVHHSADCHAQWAQRILNIINETTTR